MSFDIKLPYRTTAEVQDFHGKKYGVITELAGMMGRKYVKLHPKLHTKYAHGMGLHPYLGIGFQVTKDFNFLLLASDYELIRLIKGDMLVIHLEGMQAMELPIDGDMVAISDNQLLHLNDTLVTHAEYHNKANKLVISCHFSPAYNAQYNDPAEGAELLKVAAMRICGAKLTIIHSEGKEQLTQYEVVE